MMLKKNPRCDDIIEIVISQGIFIDTKSSSPMLVWILTTSQIPPWHFRLFAVILVFFFHPFWKAHWFFTVSRCLWSGSQFDESLAHWARGSLLLLFVQSTKSTSIDGRAVEDRGAFALLSGFDCCARASVAVIQSQYAHTQSIVVRVWSALCQRNEHWGEACWSCCGFDYQFPTIGMGEMWPLMDFNLEWTFLPLQWLSSWASKVCLLRSFMFVSCVCFPDPRIFWFGHFPKFLPQIPWGGLAPLLLGWMFLISLFSGSASYIAFSALYFVISLVVVLGTCYACNKANGMRNHAASFSLDVQNATCTSNKDTKMIREAIGGAMWMWKTRALFWTCVELMANSVQVVFASVDSIQVYFFLMLKVQLCT